MLKSIRSTLAIALVASAAFGGAALASSGDYYDGASAEPAASVDLFQTSSIGTQVQVDRNGTSVVSDQNVDRGDYYQGATRPL